MLHCFFVVCRLYHIRCIFFIICFTPSLLRITKTCLYNFDPLKPHFYIVKTGVYRDINYFFLFLLKNIYSGYSLEPHRRGGSNEYPQSMFWAEIWKQNIKVFLSEKFQFLEVLLYIYLNRRIFVMPSFGASGKLFEIVAFPGYLHIFFA